MEPASFQQIPNAPFAYWVSERIRRLFVELPAFEGEGRTVRVGLQTGDDFRFVRTTWEAPNPVSVKKDVGWAPLAKGGSYSPYYADIFLVINYGQRGYELSAFHGSVIRNPGFYQRPGITWPRRTDGLSFRVLPTGCVFADKGPAAFMIEDDVSQLFELLGLCNSGAFAIALGTQLARVELARSFEVGLVQSTPVPRVSKENVKPSIESAWKTKRATDTATLTSHAFNAPALAPGRKPQPTR